ncbi:MAG: hypothetical protein JNG85_07985, partial [Spirochaetaceae bacterium]|nr:hypothetical protein [Spirochaetaceae bacterium]
MIQRSPFRLALALGVLASSLFLAACPQPIDGSVASRMTDRSLPTLSILSPTEGSAYAQTLVVQGQASDDGSLAAIRYTVSGALGLLASGEAAIGAGGAFQFSVDTVAFSGPLAVAVEAVDWNGNVAKAGVSLAPGASSLSSFTAAASSKSVSLSWEPVAGATGYTVYWATGSSTPTVNSPGQVSLGAGATGYDLSGLPNALLHTFLLKATTASASYWSGFVKALPQSSLTLAPLVAGAYGEIRLEWDAVEGVTEYEIYRAVDNPAGVFENLAGTVSGTSHVDGAVTDGHWYYYRVRANVAGASLSAANGAQTVPLPPESERLSSVTLPVTASRVRSHTASGATTVYVASGGAGIA